MSATPRRVPAIKVPRLYPSKAFSSLPAVHPLDPPLNPPAQSSTYKRLISLFNSSSSHCSLCDSSSSYSFCGKSSGSNYYSQNLLDASNWHCINSHERRMIEVKLAKIIKCHHGDVLDGFMLCPNLLVKVMKLLDSRDAAFAFFKLAFFDYSDDDVVYSCCLAAHLLAAQNLRLLAQDVISWVIFRIGVCRSQKVVKFMWDHHHEYESDLSVLDSLMRSFLNVGLGYEALRVLIKIREVGLKPQISAIDILFKWLLKVGDYSSVSRLLKDMILKGPRPSNFLFDTLIHGFCKKGLVHIGESLLHVMWRYGCWPDVYACNMLIKAYCMGGDGSEADKWMETMIDMGIEPNNVTYNTVISALCRQGNIADARSLYQKSGLSPSVFIYNSLMDGCVKARDIVLAKIIYHEMWKEGVRPNCVTFNILLSGHYKYGRVEDGDQLLEELEKLTWSEVEECSFHDSYVAGLCWKSPEMAAEHLRSILEKGISVSLFAFNSIIAAYSRTHEENKAIEVYKLMVEFGFSPSSSTCSYLLMGLSRKGRVAEARNLLNEMIEKCYPINKSAFTIVLDGYFKIGDLIEAKDLWEEMKYQGLSPDVVAYSAYINGLCKAGLVDAANDMFKEMSAKVKPNNFVYSSLICGFCTDGRLDRALKLQREMRQNWNLHPDIFTFNAIIKGYCRLGSLESAMMVFREMKQFGVTPDVVTYNTLIHAHCKEVGIASAESWLKKHREWDPDITTYNIRIHGFCSSMNMNTAVKLLDELVSFGFVPNTVTYNSMVSGMCKDVLDNAMVLTAKLIKMAFVPNVITVNTLLSGYCKQGMPEKALMWVQSLSEISFDFDDVSYEIMVRARDDNEKVCDEGYGRELCRGTSKSCPSLDFLMNVTYYYLCRNKLQSNRTHHPLVLDGP